MLTFREPLSDVRMPIAVRPGQMVGLGLILPPGAGLLTCTRVLVVGDLVRRVLEDVHSAQVLGVVITEDQAAADAAWCAELMVRPLIGVYTTQVVAEADMGMPLNLVITVAGSGYELRTWPQLVQVAAAKAAAAYSEFDPTSVRFALASVDYAQPLEITRSALERCVAILDGWRTCVGQWSGHPSRPIPATWRSAAIAALDDDLDVVRVVEMMTELEGAKDIEPGAKFEAFAYLDRVLAVDLARDLGRIRR